MSKKVGERRQPCLTPMVVRRKGRLHWWLCYWAACGTARLENELSREKRQNGGLTTQKALLLPTIGRPLVWLSSGEDGSFPKGKNSEKNSVDIHENSFGFCSLIIPVNFTRDYPCLFSSVFFFRRTFCPFCYPMSFLLQLSLSVAPFARSSIPCLFHFSSLRSLYLLFVLLSHVFFSSVLFLRRTFCSFCYSMSFSLQFSSFVAPFARSSIPCLFFFSPLRSLYLLPVLLFHVFSSSVVFVRCTFCPFFYPMSFLLQSSSFVVPFARSAIPCLFHFSSLRSSNTLNTSAVTQDFLTALRLPRISLAVSVTAAMKVLIGVSTSMLSTSSVVGDANPPPIITWKVTTSSRSLSTHLYLV